MWKGRNLCKNNYFFMTDLGQFLSSLHLLSFCDLNPNHDEMRSLKSHSFRRFELNKYQKQCLLNNDDSHKWELGIHGILTVNNFVTHSWLWQTSSWNLSAYSHPWDVSGFVRLFYILSKNKIFRIFGRHILDFWSIICRFSWIYRAFSVKNLVFVKIKNKRTKPDTSQSL